MCASGGGLFLRLPRGGKVTRTLIARSSSADLSARADSAASRADSAACSFRWSCWLAVEGWIWGVGSGRRRACGVRGVPIEAGAGNAARAEMPKEQARCGGRHLIEVSARGRLRLLDAAEEVGFTSLWTQHSRRFHQSQFATLASSGREMIDQARASHDSTSAARTAAPMRRASRSKRRSCSCEEKRHMCRQEYA